MDVDEEGAILEPDGVLGVGEPAGSGLQASDMHGDDCKENVDEQAVPMVVAEAGDCPVSKGQRTAAYTGGPSAPTMPDGAEQAGYAGAEGVSSASPNAGAALPLRRLSTSEPSTPSRVARPPKW